MRQRKRSEACGNADCDFLNVDVFPKNAVWIFGVFQTPETTKPRIAGLLDMVPAPDERYVSAGLGFSGIWSSLKNSAYPNK